MNREISKSRLSRPVSFMVKSAFMLMVAFVAVQCSPKGETAAAGEEAPEQKVSESRIPPIAYINVDSLLANYNFAKELTEAYLRKTENYRMSMNEKSRAFEKEVASFQRKVENNAFLSQQRMEDAQSLLVKKQDELRNLDARFSNELMEEQQKINAQLSDSIYNFLKQYNEVKKYELIISNTGRDNILVGNPKYNITQEVTDQLNKRYVGKK